VHNFAVKFHDNRSSATHTHTINTANDISSSTQPHKARTLVN